MVSHNIHTIATTQKLKELQPKDLEFVIKRRIVEDKQEYRAALVATIDQRSVECCFERGAGDATFYDSTQRAGDKLRDVMWRFMCSKRSDYVLKPSE